MSGLTDNMASMAFVGNVPYAANVYPGEVTQGFTVAPVCP